MRSLASKNKITLEKKKRKGVENNMSEQKPIVTIREAKNGYVVCHSYSTGEGRKMKYCNDEYVFDYKEDAFDLAQDLIL